MTHFILFLISFTVLFQQPPERLPDRVSVTEFTLRKYIVKSEMPLFPKLSLRRKSQGVAVCQVRLDSEGRVTEVAIWEAPDQLIAKAVDRAVHAWKFKPPTLRGKTVPLVGKLTFYFQIQNGKGVVRNAKAFEQ